MTVVSLIITVAAVAVGGALVLASVPAVLLWVRVLRARRRGNAPAPDAAQNAASATREIPIARE